LNDDDLLQGVVHPAVLSMEIECDPNNEVISVVVQKGLAQG
jgi:hypothetical protein